jgi:23S rRNA (adenine2503-C2)-methyltransferase
MESLVVVDRVKSKFDNTIKYIFKTTDGGLIVEFSYIDKDDGKDIICIPCQTMCNMACKFCHTTEYIGKIKCRNLTEVEMFEGVEFIYKERNLGQKVLLVSLMGCGEPVCNVPNVIMAMLAMKNHLPAPLVRFAIATSLPRKNWLDFFTLTKNIAEHQLLVKMHLSLHYTIDQIRHEWMPRGLDIIPALSAMDFYRKLTGNPVEIHYALISGVNDTEQDAILLMNFLKDRDFNIKFLFYNEKPTLNAKASPKDRLQVFRAYFDRCGIKHEYYVPPGLDVGASCGQFLMDYYVKYGEKSG